MSFRDRRSVGKAIDVRFKNMRRNGSRLHGQRASGVFADLWGMKHDETTYLFGNI